MRICVYGAASPTIDPEYIKQVELMGKALAERGHSLVFGGGGNGLMGAAARGFRDGGAEIFGVIPKFFDNENVEEICDFCTELVMPETMRERKQIMEDNADAFIVVPGGIGTFEEFFEILTLKQLQQHNKAIAIFNVDGYFDDMLKMMQKGADTEFISDMTLGLYKVFTDVDEMLDYLETYVPKAEDVNRLRNLLEEIWKNYVSGQKKMKCAVNFALS